MWIRSQDGETLVDCDNVYYLRRLTFEEGNYLHCKVNDLSHILGEYSTKEKALKVLDMIQERIEEPTYTNVRAVEYDHYDREVFQMPQDEEVITDG